MARTTALLLLALCLSTSPVRAQVEILCDGTACGGTGVTSGGARDYVYDVVLSVTANVTDIYIATDDGVWANYKDLVCPIGWSIVTSAESVNLLPRNTLPPNGVTQSLRRNCDAAHAHRTASSPCGTAGFLLHFCGTSLAGWSPMGPGLVSFRFGFNHPKVAAHSQDWEPEDVEWGSFSGATAVRFADWSATVGDQAADPDVGPLHAPRYSGHPYQTMADESGISVAGTDSAFVWYPEVVAALNAGMTGDLYHSYILMIDAPYSGGFGCLTEMGDRILVGASSQANWALTNPESNKLHYLWKVESELTSNTPTPVRDLMLSAIVAMNNAVVVKDATPAPFYSPGGDVIRFLNPNDATLVTPKYIGLRLFGGKDRKTRAKNSLLTMKNAFKNLLGVTDGQITTILPVGTKKQLTQLLTDSFGGVNWQSVVVIAGEGARRRRPANLASKPNPSSGKMAISVVIPTASYMEDPLVVEPTVHIDTVNLLDGSDVLFNGEWIGSLSPEPGTRFSSFVLDPSQLAPAGEDNEVFLPNLTSGQGVAEIYLSTGSVGDSTETATSAPSLGSVRLFANVPNPFNPTTEIRFELPRPDRARLRVFDVRGRHVATLMDRSLPAGLHVIHWKGLDDAGASVASGVYIYRLESGGVTESRQMVLVR